MFKIISLGKIQMIITEEMNQKPYKYATHCLKQVETTLFICTETFQYLYVDNTWQPSDVYFGILKEIEIELHDWIDPLEAYYIERKDIQRYQKLLDERGLDSLKQEHIKLGNSNSMGSLPNLYAISVVLFNNNLKFN